MADDLGPDIAEVIDELGSTFQVVRSPINITEKVLADMREMVRDPAFQEHHFDATLSYDTKIVPGDVIQSGGDSFLVMNKTMDDFEDAVVKYNAILFKCNLPDTTLILIPSEIKNSVTFAVTQDWIIRQAPVYGMIFNDTRGATINAAAMTGKEPTFKLKCCVPESYNVQRLDRLYLSVGEYYRVEDIEKHQYPGIHVLVLVEDERPEYLHVSPSSSPSTSPSSSPSVS